MEDFGFARTEEPAKGSALQAEWLDSFKPNNSRTEKAALALLKPEAEKEDGPGKDVADRLDKELKTFATAKLDNPSKDMQTFQKIVGSFCDDPDKKHAIKAFGDEYPRFKVQMEKEIGETYEAIKTEGDKQPGRAELNADLDTKLQSFFSKVESLPSNESNRIIELLEWRDGETKSQHQDRVRAGLAGNKDVLDSYNKMETASDKVDANKSKLELDLESKYKQQLEDLKTFRQISNKVVIRSEIDY